MFEKILQAFDLARRPFGAMPDSKCFFTTESVQATLDELKAGVERGQGISILTGDAGSGKSLLCERLKVELASTFEVVLLRHAKFPSSRAMLLEILCELGESFEGRDEAELRLALRQRVQRVRPDREALLLIVDEAENFSTDALEELRILADLAEDGVELVRLVLAGQWRLEERLAEREFAALNQRVSTHASLQALSTSESMEYVNFRLKWAGGNPETIFTEQALQFVARAANGLPRCLNLLADHCLFLAQPQGERPVVADTVRRALAEMKRLPLQWNDLHDLSSFAANDDAEFADETSFELPVEDTLFEVPVANSAASTSSFEFGGDGAIDLKTSVTESIDESVATASAASESTVFEFGADTVEVGVVRTVPNGVENSYIGETAAFSSQETEMTATDIRGGSAEHRDESKNSVDEPASRIVETNTIAANDGCCITITAPCRSRKHEQRIVDVADAADLLAREDSKSCRSDSTEWCEAASAACVTPHETEADERPALSTASVVEEPDPLIEVTLSHEEQPVPQFVEEIVLDHYAALQEPEFSGIIWNFARPVQEVADVEETAAAVEPSANVIEPEPIADESPRMTLEFSPHFEQRQERRERMAAGDVEEVAEDSDASESSLRFDGVVEDIRPLQPSRYLDAIMPMLSEVIDPDGDAVLPEASNRSREEIEAELIDALTSGEPDIEDHLGSEVLDLCLDTQAAIRQARDSVVESLKGQLDVIDPSDDDEEFDRAMLRGFDVVQPEEEPIKSVAAKNDRKAEMSQERRQSEDRVPDLQNQTPRQFGRLFSELRRRQRLVG